MLRPVLKVLQEHKVSRDHKVFLEHKAFQDYRVLPVLKVLQEHKALPVLKVLPVQPGASHRLHSCAARSIKP
ncbi:hypothetical protein J21TS7_59230 [Paenibacillus cineris]|uniref:Uncharacterized protein n=1 Tax=Paenibacillus cineris TaxID=237530 RepID=A0ABQ4LMR7_9BACL|nr:hypothetical protein J21TS7_59230 [Paenibacillus cineris]